MVVASCVELMLLDHGMNVHGLASKLGLFPCPHHQYTGVDVIGSEPRYAVLPLTAVVIVYYCLLTARMVPLLSPAPPYSPACPCSSSAQAVTFSIRQSPPHQDCCSFTCN
ncbi:hypothetical protein M0R45_001068 [Rubus argutus]|uniref:Uncharacterized protein n=1 Tax=Rubus argutus TaxID=59490 RepID=A0AAW1VMJ4_RUBAR